MPFWRGGGRNYAGGIYHDLFQVPRKECQFLCRECGAFHDNIHRSTCTPVLSRSEVYIPVVRELGRRQTPHKLRCRQRVTPTLPACVCMC